jgi:hypothetical protein
MMAANNLTGLQSIACGRDILRTDEAAAAINRKPQTLRKWACYEDGPIRPIRINGRLAWRVVDLLALLNGQEVVS